MLVNDVADLLGSYLVLGMRWSFCLVGIIVRDAKVSSSHAFFSSVERKFE